MNVQQLFLFTRNLVNKNSAAVTLVALVVMSITAIDIVQQLRKPRYNAGNVDAYYYDLETNGLFVGKTADLPPIAGPGSTAPNDLTAVRAYVFACRDCNDTRDRYIGWVEGFSSEAREAFGHARRDDMHGDPSFDSPPMFPPGTPFVPMPEHGHMIAVPDANDPTWKNRFYDFTSTEAMQIMQKSHERCGGLMPISCTP